MFDALQGERPELVEPASTPAPRGVARQFRSWMVRPVPPALCSGVSSLISLSPPSRLCRRGRANTGRAAAGESSPSLASTKLPELFASKGQSTKTSLPNLPRYKGVFLDIVGLGALSCSSNCLFVCIVAAFRC